jgi:DNA-binding MarR family transcriptional regulator
LDIFKRSSAIFNNTEEQKPRSVYSGSLSDRMRSFWQHRCEQVELFPECALNYPAWDILLLCYIAQTEGRPLCVKQIECQLVETHAALLRRISAMEQEGILLRCRDDGDWRRTLVTLTPEGVARMQLFLKTVAQELPASRPDNANKERIRPSLSP